MATRSSLVHSIIMHLVYFHDEYKCERQEQLKYHRKKFKFSYFKIQMCLYVCVHWKYKY